MATRFMWCEDEDSVRIGFGALKEGWYVRFKGTVDGEVFAATQLIQQVQ